MRSRALQVAGGLLAAVLAVALISVLLYSRGTINPQISHGGQCAYLYSPGVSMRPNLNEEAIVVINESAANSCTVTVPAISFIDSAGNPLDVPQDFAPGAANGFQGLRPMGAAAIPFSIQPSSCSATSLQYAEIRATFGAGVQIRIWAVGDLCQGSRIVVSAPVPAVDCGGGNVAWGSPKPTC